VIARVWCARTAHNQLNAHLKHFSEQVLLELKKCDGFASATLLTRDVDGEKEITVTTFWKSSEAIDAFAGSDREAAVVAPEAAPLLKSYDRRVRHYTVDLAANPELISPFPGRG
jgi:heme-degrading monooxygenase HmoA